MTIQDARQAYKNLQNVAEQTFGCPRKRFTDMVCKCVQGNEPEDFVIAAQSTLAHLQRKSMRPKRGFKRGLGYAKELAIEVNTEAAQAEIKNLPQAKPLLAGKRPLAKSAPNSVKHFAANGWL